jgi:hypothetical protein
VIKFEAPEKLATFCSFYRIIHGFKKSLSKKLCCQIKVKPRPAPILPPPQPEEDPLERLKRELQNDQDRIQK